MAESIITTVVGIIVALASALGGYPANSGSQDAPSQRWSLPAPLMEKDAHKWDHGALRESVHEWVESLVQRLKQEAAARSAPGPQQETPGKPGERPGCTTEEASGPGWSSTRVRCVQETSKNGSFSSSIIVSSSSVNVTSTSTDDAP